MQVVGCQLNIEWENKKANHEKIRNLLGRFPLRKDALVVLPEMFSTGFSMNVSEIHEDERPESTNFLVDLAREKGVFVIGGVVTRSSDGKGRNELVVASPEGSEVARYCKIHPFSFGLESSFYTGGERVTTFLWQDCTVSPFICYDLRFPEIFRHAVRLGAELMVVIANWPQSRESHWMALLQARAIENQCYLIGVNRCGRDPKLSYSGRSLVIDPKGKILVDAGNDEQVFGAEIDLETLRTYRQDFPALQDIHPKFLGSPEDGAQP